VALVIPKKSTHFPPGAAVALTLGAVPSPTLFPVRCFEAGGGQAAAAAGQFLALQALSLDPSVNTLPSRLKILPWGEIKTNKGTIICNDVTLATVPGMQAATRYDKVALDFQHNTVPGSSAYQASAEPRPVAGYGTIEVVKGEGVYLSAIEWTKEGREKFANRDYPDLSPALVTNEAGEVVWFHSAAMVRQGEIDGLTLFEAGTLPGPIKAFTAGSEGSGAGQGSGGDKSAFYRGLLVALLGAGEAATDDELATAAKTFAAQREKDAAPDMKSFEARLDALQRALESSHKDAEVARAAREGKVIPLSAAEIESTPLTVLTAMINRLPEVVPLEARTPEKIKEFAAPQGGPASASVAEEVRRNLGLTEEAWKKYNP
jgi:phage I-like protein